ncbi:ABC transporter substrate-binding protein [Clostridium estertheticum]|uniref:Nitrate ABC transporter substrate-binding protein n=1 Tax=Clostridium estertheticum subsp. estertheticum TaxID=1552 RepID=A0A1J0GK95_9CLOT|nr:ABC transporter substrate-binding protein [Clostridium estertheticum]APC41753.1 nitrate ABC transporter substrate-binding protein [Clostridium estertheticum subsp. estertheticum]MBU3073410.1 ABC transporter substrate-binding protein [Clostridium estertheticum]MBU3163349.1 ABC transporter substrate-binding protein [Clostridium estertheticum]MBZ9616362.1 ABC transporter substrate-binding protein [Clostridium estertheticum subsp. laramiense]WAG72098.1 ABC transporter substrate-binding protein 
MKIKKMSIFSIFLSLALVTTLFSGCTPKTKTTPLVKVKLNEVVRSIFYAPMYAAISQGFFKEEGLDINLSTGQGADKTMQQVLSKASDIGLAGPEQVIYIYNQKRTDYPVIFAQLTQKDGSFLVSKKAEANFKWESLKGKTLIGGRPGGVPEMALEYVLKNHGINPGVDVNLITNLAFTATAGAFKAGTGDYVALFEPTASTLSNNNSGNIVASVGDSAGIIPYTCFFATKSYITENPAVLQKFTNAIYKGQKWVNSNSDKDVITSIKSYFPGTDEAVLISSIKNYRNINAFSTNPTLTTENLTKLMDIIQSYKASLIPTRPNFDTIVNTTFSKKAVTTIK